MTDKNSLHFAMASRSKSEKKYIKWLFSFELFAVVILRLGIQQYQNWANILRSTVIKIELNVRLSKRG